MNPDRLEKVLAAYVAQPLPLASEPSNAEIWREIDRRRQQTVWTRLLPMLDWRELFGEPRLAMAALAFAIMIGVVPAALIARTENEKRLARHSIGFEVFALDSTETLGSVFKPVARTANHDR